MARAAGLVLCGGASRRMGRSKADLPFGDETLLERVVRILGAVLNPVIVVAGPTQVVPPGMIVVHDTEAWAGPLAGLANGLAALRGAEIAFATGCDCPFLTPEIIGTMTDNCPSSGAAVANFGGAIQPLPAAYHVGSRHVAATLLARGERSLRSLLDGIAISHISESRMRLVDPDLAAFAPLNTPLDYEAALVRLRRGV